MRVIGVDPGYDRCGIAVVERLGETDTVLTSTCLETDRALSLAERLYSLGQRFTEHLTTHRPDALAIETIFFNSNQKTAIGVAQARGILIYLAQLHQCTVLEFGPQEVKVALTGYGKSDKQAVISMVKQLVNKAPSQALDDEYDAIAVGVTALAHHR